VETAFLLVVIGVAAGMQALSGFGFALLAVPVLVVVVLAGRLARPSGRDGSVAAVGGAFDVAATAFIGLALEGGALSIVAVLSSLYPVVAVFLAFVILRERLRPLQAVGAALALSGVVLIAAG